MKQKILAKSEKNRIVAGVCGGIGEYFGIDPTVVRLVFAILIIMHGMGLLLYLVLFLIMPSPSAAGKLPHEVIRENARKMEEDAKKGRINFRFIAGVVLVLAGVLFLLQEFYSGVFALLSKFLLPLAAIVAGLSLLLANLKSGGN